MSADKVPDQNLLDVLRQSSHVDIDSLDSKAARTLGPFIDSTSNQAIAYAELSLKHHQNILREASRYAVQNTHYPDVSVAELAVEVATIMLSLQMRPALIGKVHTQANPYHAYSTAQTVAAGKRILSIAKDLEPTFTAQHLSVKIASTFEGLLACKQLQEDGIHTLATTLFTIEQAALAGEVGCSYIAPYVNELKVHFEPGYVDPAPNFQLCVDSQQYYSRHGFETQVLPASLTSPQEVMALAGANHITVPPALLQALSEIPATASTQQDYPTRFKKVTQFPEPSQSTQATKAAGTGIDGTAAIIPHHENAPETKLNFLNNEAGFRLALTRKDAGIAEKKLIDAINIFCDKQTQLEQLIAPYLEAAKSDAAHA